MARFRATIEGSRGMASRLGTESSGMVATINGWNVGVYVNIFVNEDGKDEIRVYKTGGSNARGPQDRIAVVTEP